MGHLSIVCRRKHDNYTKSSKAVDTYRMVETQKDIDETSNHEYEDGVQYVYTIKGESRTKSA